MSTTQNEAPSSNIGLMHSPASPDAQQALTRPNKHAWSEDEDAEVMRLWRSGWTAAQIARAMPGRLTRNAVIGRLHRVGLKRGYQTRSERSERSIKRQPGRKNRPPRSKNPFALYHVGQAKPATKPRAPIAEQPDKSGLAPLIVGALDPTDATLALTRTSCRWPYGDPKVAGFGYCGRPVGLEGASYCIGHGGKPAALACVREA